MLGLDEGPQVVVDAFKHTSHVRSVARVVAAAVAVLLLLPGCSSDDGDAALEDVAAQLRTLERVALEMQVEVDGVGFTIDGALSVSGDRPLPVAHLTYMPLGEGTPTTVVLTGDDGFVLVEEEAYRLPPQQLAVLRIPQGGGSSALSAIRLDRWLDVERAREGVYEGPGDPDVVLDDVVALASGLGARDVVPGTVDGTLRVRIVADEELDLRELVAEADGFRFALRLDEHGEPVEVEPPTDARPFDELAR